MGAKSVSLTNDRHGKTDDRLTITMDASDEEYDDFLASEVLGKGLDWPPIRVFQPQTAEKRVRMVVKG